MARSGRAHLYDGMPQGGWPAAVGLGLTCTTGSPQGGWPAAVGLGLTCTTGSPQG
jgi:hypothetical protein